MKYLLLHNKGPKGRHTHRVERPQGFVLTTGGGGAADQVDWYVNNNTVTMETPT